MTAAPGLKLLIVSEMSPPYATGGGEVRYALLARHLVAAGHRVTWLSMKQRQSPADEVIDGVKHLHRGPHIHHPPTRPFFKKLAFMVRVFWHVLRYRYQVVDCQTYAPLPAAWLACKLTGTPLVATIHDTAAVTSPGAASDQWLSTFDRVLASRVERWLCGLSYDHVLTVSHAVKADLVGRLGVPPARISVVPNAVEIEHVDAIAARADKVDLIFVGRLVPHKHPEAFLEAAAQVNARRHSQGRSPLKLKMVGGGPLAAQAESTARRLGLTESLTTVGELEHHDEVIAHIKSARLLVLPSTREGFGLVLAEAMACRTGVAAYRLPPVLETLGDALQEHLVPPGDVSQLAALIETLMNDPARAGRAIEMGRKRVEERFDAKQFALDVAGLYRQVAGQRDQPRPGQNSA